MQEHKSPKFEITKVATAKNFAHATEAISFWSTVDNTELRGTLEIPKSNDSFAVLLIGGSGKTNRDETVPAILTQSGKTEKLFVQLTEVISSLGIPSFRYDKRGVINERGDTDPAIWATANRENLISDALDAAKVLLHRLQLPPRNLIILGHSEGTIIAVEVALRLKEAHSLFFFGSQARPMREIIFYQIVEAPMQLNGDLRREELVLDYEAAIKTITTSNDTFAPDGKPMEWYRQFLVADSNENRIRGINSPIYLFHGEDDLQTPIEEIYRLRKSNLKNLHIKTYPGLGHGFSERLNSVPTLGPIQDHVLMDFRDLLAADCH